MIAYLAGAGAVVAGLALRRPLAWVAGLSPVPPVPPVPGSDEPSARGAVRGIARIFAGLCALPLLVGGTGGDMLLGAVLAGVAAARRVPAVGLAFVGAAGAAATRVGSTAMDDVSGAHGVLGPALSSPEITVAVAAACAAAACFLAVVVLLPPRVGTGLFGGGPEAVADSILPPLALAVGVAVALGPPIGPGVAAGAGLARAGVGLSAWVVGALLRRLVPSAWPVRFVGYAAALLGLAGVVTAVAGR